MSRDSSATHLHLTSSRHADLFEEFCRPPSTVANTNTGLAPNTNPHSSHGNTVSGPINDGSGMTTLPGSFLPYEEIQLPPHLMPLNPEDEDGVVPDMHAAFGINRALGQGQGSVGGVGSGAAANTAAGGASGGETSTAGVQREPAWRDLGLLGLVADTRTDVGGQKKMAGSRREGKRTGLLFLR